MPLLSKYPGAAPDYSHHYRNNIDAATADDDDPYYHCRRHHHHRDGSNDIDDDNNKDEKQPCETLTAYGIEVTAVMAIRAFDRTM